MAQDQFFPPLLDSFEDTRATLHAYALGLAAIPRAHAIAHPKWWHISLEVRPDGLVTDNIGLSDGRLLNLRMDPRLGEVVIQTSDGRRRRFPMTGGLTGTEFADQLFEAVAEDGLEGPYERDKFESDEPGRYDPPAAELLFELFVKVERLFERHRATLPGQPGPVQIWPHNFDMAFEWFGTRVETYEEEGDVTEYLAQLNLGFYLPTRPYFYSNPWPFEADQLLDKQLPSGAMWFTEGWEGTILYYDQLQEDDQAADKLLAYAGAVFEISAPTLTA